MTARASVAAGLAAWADELDRDAATLRARGTEVALEVAGVAERQAAACRRALARVEGGRDVARALVEELLVAPGCEGEDMMPVDEAGP